MLTVNAHALCSPRRNANICRLQHGLVSLAGERNIVFNSVATLIVGETEATSGILCTSRGVVPDYHK